MGTLSFSQRHSSQTPSDATSNTSKAGARTQAMRALRPLRRETWAPNKQTLVTDRRVDMDVPS